MKKQVFNTLPLWKRIVIGGMARNFFYCMLFFQVVVIWAMFHFGFPIRGFLFTAFFILQWWSIQRYFQIGCHDE
jgi:hypothetical protein